MINKVIFIKLFVSKVTKVIYGKMGMGYKFEV